MPFLPDSTEDFITVNNEKILVDRYDHRTGVVQYPRAIAAPNSRSLPGIQVAARGGVEKRTRVNGFAFYCVERVVEWSRHYQSLSDLIESPSGCSLAVA